ncbi:MAG: polysaccharide biosynthesis/export family protein [Bryobacteraceae bacterium]|nr:polysaccharide biosynthesis/export family protein [Bryobacteraceae bacterium]
MKLVLLLLTLSLTVLLGADSSNSDSSYILGPDDEVVIRVLDLPEINERAVRIDMRGNINLPLAGRLRAAGLTVEELEAAIAERLQTYLQKPVVTVAIAEFRSQPVSVLGAVAEPGVHQVQGRKTLYEILSQVGGLKPDAGNVIKITRRKESGPLPLPNAKLDETGQFYIGEVRVKSIMEAENPEENIFVQPNDIISVPKAELVYVIGSVKRSGGFVLNEKESLSVLQVLSLAEGLERTAAPGKAKILRPVGDGSTRQEIPVDLKKLMAGKASDVYMKANDILFVPNSAARAASLRAAEAAIQITTGIIIWRR